MQHKQMINKKHIGRLAPLNLQTLRPVIPPFLTVLMTLEKIENTGADFRSITENIDTSTPAGRMMMQIAGSFAEFERAMLRERTKNGLLVARQEGRVGGRRTKLTPQQQKEIFSLVTSGQKTGADAARLFRVHPSTVVRLLARHRMTEIKQT